MLNEFLDLSPLRLKEYFNKEGVVIMSSERIENFVIKWCSKSQSTMVISDKIEEFIRERKIVIGYLENKGMFSYLKKKFKLEETRGENKGILGKFDPKYNFFYIILDHNTTLFGKAIIEIPPIITHELCHMIAYNNYKTFLRYTMKPYLIPFYREFFSIIAPESTEIIALNKNKKIQTGGEFKADRNRLETFVEDLVVLNDSKNSGLGGTGLSLSDSVSLYSSFLKDCGVKEHKEIAKNIVGLFHAVRRGGGTAGYERIREALYYSYDLLGYNVRKMTYAYQEVIFPSEVVCIMNEFKPSNYIRAMVNNIKYR